MAVCVSGTPPMPPPANALLSSKVQSASKHGHISLDFHAAHTLEITSLAFSDDGQLLVSGSFDRKVAIWQAEVILMHLLPVNH